MTRPPPLKHPSKFGLIKLRYHKRNGTLTYEQKGGNQSTSDGHGVSLDAHIHALYGLILQTRARKILMIGCGGGTLATTLSRAGHKVTVVDIDPMSIKLARRHFKLPKNVRARVGDGLAFMQRARAKFDALILDAFVGEHIPDHLKKTALMDAAAHCVGRRGVVLVNVCLDKRADRTADRIATGFKGSGWRVRLLDSPGSERNAIVLAGRVKDLRRPKLLSPPAAGAKTTAKELKAMFFRRVKKSR